MPCSVPSVETDRDDRAPGPSSEPTETRDDGRKRVLYAITRANLGGAQKHLLWLVDAARERYRPLVLVGESGFLTDALEARGIEYRCLPSLKREISPGSDWRAVRDIRREIRRHRPHLVHLHSFKACALGRLAALGLGVPVLVTAHGWTFTDGNPATRRTVGILVERLLARACARIIVVCRRDLEIAVARRISSPERLVMIHNGVPDKDASAIERHSRGSRVKLVNVGRICRQKDQVGLASILPSATADVEMRFIGDGPERAKLEQIVEREKLDQRVILETDNFDPAGRLRESHVYVSWSRWEGLSLGMIEALRSGLPIVATDVGGTNELVCPGVNGFLVDHGDDQAFLAAIKTLAEDAELRARMGSASRRIYLENFTLDRCLSRTLGVYSELAGADNAPEVRTG